ncbi:MAG: DUF5990 family protein [Acidobacteriota bacterium]
MGKRVPQTSKPKVAKEARAEIALRIVLQQPPAGVDFGLQKGRGSGYEVVQKQRSTDGDLKFDFAVTVKAGKEVLPDFAGPFVQGPAGERFVYLDIGTCAGQENTPWSRRLKIPLSGITWDLANSHDTLIALIPGTGTDGGPSCAYAWRKRNPSWQWQLDGR